MSNSYNSKSIKILKGLDAVRKRPGMYIGDTYDGSGLHHMVFEIIDNSIDESISGFCKNIEVTLYNDNSISILDDGRGIPTDIHKKEGISAAELVMTVLHSGAKFNNNYYIVSGGLHGVGLSVVNALSEKLELKIYREKKIYYQLFKYGVPDKKLSVVGVTNLNGTYIRFWPDKKIFSNIIKFKYSIIFNRLNELSFLNPGLNIKLIDKKKNIIHSFFNKNGIKEFLYFLCKDKVFIHNKIFYFYNKNKNFIIEVVCRWVDSFKNNILCFTNNISQIDGGTHLYGFKSAVTRTINNYIYQEKKKKINKLNITGEDVREGLFAIISIKLPNPKFSSQTKEKLISSEVRCWVESLVSENLFCFLLENPQESKLIINKIIKSSKIRESAKKAREISRKKNNLELFSISGKLSDCQEKDPKKSEIFLVEGDSAGGSAKQGRNRKNQAILPLKGKIINVEKNTLEKILFSQEIATLITALGCGIGNNNFSIEKIRYHKIIIMTDADVDGAHIRTLLLTFFYRYMPEIINKGYLYIAQPPLFRIKKNKKEFFVNKKKDLNLKRFLFSFENINVYYKKDKILLNEINLVKYSLMYKKLSKNLFEKKYFFSDYILEKLIIFDEININDNNILKIWINKFIYFLNKKNNLNIKIKGKIKLLNCYFDKIKIYIYDYINNKFYYIDKLFFIKYKSILNKLKIVLKNFYNKEKKYILFNNKILYFNEFYNLINFVIKKNKNEIFIQRYKGLGEMNPDQLWKTTMDPNNRLLSCILLKDIIKTDNIFKILMGDNVELRKKFIEKNAINIKNIDI